MRVQRLIVSSRIWCLAALVLGNVLCGGCSRGPAEREPVDPVWEAFEAGKAAYTKGVADEKNILGPELDRALIELSKALFYNPRYSEAYYLRGKVFFALGLYQLAVEDYSKAIGFQLRYPEAYLARAEAYYQLKKFSQAIDDAQRAIRQDPQKGKAYTVLGEAYFYSELPDYLEARNSLLVAQRLDKRFDAEKLLRQAEEKVRLAPPAEKEVSPSLWKPVETGDKRRRTAKGDSPIFHDHAVGMVPEKLGQSPGSVEKLLSEARALASKQEQFSRAMALCEEAEKIDPKAAEVYYDRGCLLLGHGSAYTAIREFDEALRCRPKYAEALLKRSLADLRVERYFAAVSDATEALRLKPESAEAYACRAEALLRQRKFASAEEDFKEALRLDSSRKSELLPMLTEARRGLEKTQHHYRQGSGLAVE